MRQFPTKFNLIDKYINGVDTQIPS